MNEQTNFELDYKILHLRGNPDWATTRTQYKKLVLKWHPDKYSGRPREIEHAKKRFIEVTKSFNRIKAFHTQYNRMPLAVAPTEKTGRNPRVDKSTATTVLDNDNIDNSALSRDENKIDTRLIKKSPLKLILWTCVACVVVFSTVLLFLILDKKANQQNAAVGVKVLREAPKSDFRPTASEIRRSVSKGAFIGTDF